MAILDDMPASLNPIGNPGSIGGFGNLVPGLGAILNGLLTQDTRLLELHTAGDSRIPDSSLLVHRVTGWEEVNLGFRFEVEVLASDAFIALKAMEGVPIQLTILTATGDNRCINGVATEVRSEGSDGSLAVYRIVVEPVTEALKRGCSWRVFLQHTDLEIVKLLLQEELDNNPVFAACLNLVDRSRGQFPQRDFVFMAGENKWDFIRRRLAKIGVSYAFVPTEGCSPDQPQHTLVLFSDSRDLDANPAGTVRFHKVEGSETEDSINGWYAHRTLQPGSVIRRTLDQCTGSLSTTTEEVQADQGQYGNALASTIVDYQYEAPLEHDDLQGHDDLTATRAQAKELLTKSFAGTGNARPFYAGSSFQLAKHPVHDHDDAQDRTFVLTRVELHAENNLPKALQEGLPRLGLPPAQTLGWEQPEAQATGLVYQNRFQCQRVSIAIVPEELPAPNPGLQTATVVGPAGETVHTDAWGRIKVSLHCAMDADHPEAGASGSDRDSCWLRVVQPSGSNGIGFNFPYRTGDEAILGFLANDPDKPVIIGCLPSGSRPPGSFSGASSLPADRTLSGIRSQEHGGTSGNEIVMDDTPGELRARIASDHAASELNLGNLRHPRSGGKATAKGEGAELRSAAANAVRGEKGLLLSAETGADQLSRDVALGNLDAALGMAKTVGDLAEQHGADTQDTKVQADLLKQAQDWEKGTTTDPKTSGGGSAILVASAPAGMALSSGDGTTIQAASNLDLVAMCNGNLSAGKRLLFRALESISLFAHTLGMKLIAGSGDISIQAQDGLLELIAAKVLRLMSISGAIELDAADGVTIRSGGAFIQVKGGSINAGGSGSWTGNFGSVSWPSGSSQDANTASFGKSTVTMDEKFRLFNPVGDPAKSMRYQITKEDGSVIQGVSDDQGFTELCSGDAMKALSIQVFGSEEE